MLTGLQFVHSFSNQSNSLSSSCQLNEFFDGQKCRLCSEKFNRVENGCFQCDSTSCTKCRDGDAFLPRFENDCNLCKNVYTGCTKCNPDMCTQCQSGFWYDVSTRMCLKCSAWLSNCEECLDKDQCIRCRPSYFLENQKCIYCRDRFGQCEECIKSECQRCKYGFTISPKTKQCVSCFEFDGACTQCNRIGSECTQCKDGHYLSNGHCYPCSEKPNCLECNAKSCTKCQAGLIPINGICTTCSEGIPNCRSCANGKCADCSPGYSVSANGLTCVKCPLNCEECSSSECLCCSNGFTKSENQCIPCREYDDNCASCSQSKGECQVCDYPGFFLNNGHCQDCSQHCLECDSFTQCRKCEEPTVQINGHCSLCEDAFPDCELCSNNVCSQCRNTSYLNIEQMKCEKCSKTLRHCEECTSSSICTKCSNSFNLSPSRGQCIQSTGIKTMKEKKGVHFWNLYFV